MALLVANQRAKIGPAGKGWTSALRTAAALAMAGMLGGCAIPPAVTIASYVGDGVLMMATGKSSADMGLSLFSGSDCSTWRVLKEENICQDTVVATPEATPVEVAQDDAMAQRQLAAMPTDPAQRHRLASATMDSAFRPLAAGTDRSGLEAGPHGSVLLAAGLPRPATTRVAMVGDTQRSARNQSIRFASAGRPDMTPQVIGETPAPEAKAAPVAPARKAVTSAKSSRKQVASAKHRRHHVAAAKTNRKHVASAKSGRKHVASAKSRRHHLANAKSSRKHTVSARHRTRTAALHRAHHPRSQAAQTAAPAKIPAPAVSAASASGAPAATVQTAAAPWHHPQPVAPPGADNSSY